MSESEPFARVRYQLLGIELTLLGGVFLVGVPLTGLSVFVPWAFMLAGLLATLFGTVR